MFEKEAEERARKLEESQTLGVYDNDEDLARDVGWNEGEVAGYEKGFKDGAEFAYNKANEWHYVKDGDKPSESKDYLTYKINGYGCHTIDITYFNSERHFWCVDCQSDVVAWKEIVPPKESD